MFRFYLTLFLIIVTSCSTSKPVASFGNDNDIEILISLGQRIRNRFPLTECGLDISRIADADLKDSLKQSNISSLSIKYFHEAISSNEYFYGNYTKLPDSCIIFSKESFRANDEKLALTLLFYFFGKTKPADFHFNTHNPDKERTTKINDSLWVYSSVHKLIMIE
jgi:hypothetical protein